MSDHIRQRNYELAMWICWNSSLGKGTGESVCTSPSELEEREAGKVKETVGMDCAGQKTEGSKGHCKD